MDRSLLRIDFFARRFQNCSVEVWEQAPAVLIRKEWAQCELVEESEWQLLMDDLEALLELNSRGHLTRGNDRDEHHSAEQNSQVADG